jgi:hypothetical protein
MNSYTYATTGGRREGDAKKQSSVHYFASSMNSAGVMMAAQLYFHLPVN